VKDQLAWKSSHSLPRHRSLPDGAKRRSTLRAFVLELSCNPATGGSIMENNFLFYAAVIGMGVLSAALMIATLFMI
jgi:hypothetical protein